MDQCPKCGEALNGATIVCPHCGATLVQEDKKRRRRSAQRVASPSWVISRRLWMRLLIGLLAVAFFVGSLAAAAYAGIYVGERDRATHRETILEEHYQAGLVALNEGRYERASAEFQYILQLDPDHALAQQGLNEARIRLEVKPTPTLEAAQSLADQLLEQAQTSYAAEDWVATARTLTQLRSLDPALKQEAVEGMLFDSLYRAGQAFLAEDHLETGISYLDQAIALRPLDADVVAERNLAAKYLDALNYWGVD